MIKRIWFDETAQALMGAEDSGSQVLIAEPVPVTADYLRSFAAEFPDGNNSWGAIKSCRNLIEIRSWALAYANQKETERTKKTWETDEEDVRLLDRKELEDYALLVGRLYDGATEVLKMIPGCPVHGSNCLPHCREWIAKQKASSEADSPLTVEVK